MKRSPGETDVPRHTTMQPDSPKKRFKIFSDLLMNMAFRAQQESNCSYCSERLEQFVVLKAIKATGTAVEAKLTII